MRIHEFDNGRTAKIWDAHIPPIEDGAMRQLENSLSVKTWKGQHIVRHAVLMPDAHQGYGVPIGSVLATRKAVIPNVVGVDIGCGMYAERLDIKSGELPPLDRLYKNITDRVPMGFGIHNTPVHSPSVMTYIRENHWELEDMGLNLDLYRAHCQLGSLGGGNHFIEVCVDERDYVWIMLHSGSRGFGNKIATFFTMKAQELITHKGDELAYFPDTHEFFGAYLRWMRRAQRYASANRAAMRDLVHGAIIATYEETGREKMKYWQEYPTGDTVVSCHHNYAETEWHFGESYLVTRKGAVNARKGKYGIVPNAMGKKSYIVMGKGNPDSLNSCSHGAGRMKSRKAARRDISLKAHREQLKGVVCNDTADTLDESPQAYKDIDLVMKSQADLVDIVHTLEAVLCCKG